MDFSIRCCGPRCRTGFAARLDRVTPSFAWDVWWRARRVRDWALPVSVAIGAALLVILGGVKALAAIETQREAAARTRVLVATIAAQGIGEHLRSVLSTAADQALVPPDVSAPIAQHVASMLHRADSMYACNCTGMPQPIGAFAVDGDAREIASGSEHRATVEALVDSLLLRARTGPPFDPTARIVAGQSAGGPWMLLINPAPARRTQRFLGLVVSAASMASQVLPKLLKYDRSLLPLALSTTQRPDSALSVTVTSAYGALLGTAGPSFSLSHARAAAMTRDSSLVVEVRLDPRISDAVATIMGPRVEQELALVTLLVLLLLITILVLALRAAALARFRQQFAVAVTHELRTPLTQILLYGETLSLGRTRSAADESRAADIVVREARRMIEAVDGILHYTHAERRRLSLNLAPFRLNEVVAEVVGTQTAPARARNAVLAAAFDGSPLVEIDSAAMQRVLSNLIDNALRHGGAKHVTISTAVAGARVDVLVDDDGCGVPSAELTTIFEPFVRGAARSANDGTGIGLAIVAELVRSMRGTVRAEHRPGGGARFRVTLPVLAEAT